MDLLMGWRTHFFNLNMLTISSSVILWISWLRLCCQARLCARCSLMSVQLAWWHWCRSKWIFRERHLQKDHHTFNRSIVPQLSNLCSFIYGIIARHTSEWSSLQPWKESPEGQECWSKKWKDSHYRCWSGSSHLFPGWWKHHGYIFCTN